MDLIIISETLNKMGVKAYATTGKPANYSFEIDGTYVVWEDENTPCPTLEEFTNLCSEFCLCCCKTDQKQTIQTAWQEEVDTGFMHDNNIFDFDDITLGIIGARLSYNESVDTPTTEDLTFYNADKVAVVFAGKNAFKSFCIAFILARNTLDQKRVSLKAQIDACATKEEVEAIIW